MWCFDDPSTFFFLNLWCFNIWGQFLIPLHVNHSLSADISNSHVWTFRSRGTNSLKHKATLWPQSFGPTKHQRRRENKYSCRQEESARGVSGRLGCCRMYVLSFNVSLFFFFLWMLVCSCARANHCSWPLNKLHIAPSCFRGCAETRKFQIWCQKKQLLNTCLRLRKHKQLRRLSWITLTVTLFQQSTSADTLIVQHLSASDFFLPQSSSSLWLLKGLINALLTFF